MRIRKRRLRARKLNCGIETEGFLWSQAVAVMYTVKVVMSQKLLKIT